MPFPQGEKLKLGPGKGHWQHFGEVDGLPSIHTDRVGRDQRGFMWFASTYFGSRGVTRYDGEEFITFTPADGLAHNIVNALYGDGDGNMWFGTDGKGLSRFDGKEWITYTDKDGLVGNSLTAILEDHTGAMWFGTDQGVSRFDGTRWTSFTEDDGLLSNMVNAIFEDQTGTMWFGTSQGVSLFDGEKWTSYTEDDGLAGHFVTAIAADHSGAMWFGTDSKGVSRFDGKEWTTYSDKDGLAGNRVYVIFADQEGYLWFGLHNSGADAGVSRYAPVGTSHAQYGSADQRFKSITLAGTQQNHIGSISADAEGGIWFGTWGGASRYEADMLRVFTSENSLESNEVLTLLLDHNNHLWFLLADYDSATWPAYRYDGQKLTRFTAADGLNSVHMLHQDHNGQLWFSTDSYQQISRYDGRIFTNFTAADGVANIGFGRSENFLKDRHGHLWIGTPHGVVYFDGQTFSKPRKLNAILVQTPLSNWVIIHQDSQGNLWFSKVPYSGVLRYDGQSYQSFTSQDGLVHNWVTTMLSDDQGHLWFGTINGLSRYTLPDKASEAKQQSGTGAFTNFTAADGLTSNNINSLWQDSRGHLWIGTWGGGFNRFDGLVFQSLTTKDGLPANTAHFNRMVAEDDKGQYWIGTSKGLVRYRPTATKPPIFITDVQTDQHHGPVEALRLPSTQNLLSFAFHGISFRTQPGRMAYVYRLEGYQDQWQWTRQKQVEYTNLPTGHYTFQVKAVDRDLNYSAAPAQVDIEVFYRPVDASLRIAQLELADLFASFYATYSHQPLGTVQLVNEDANPIQATLRFFLPGLMRQPFDQALTLSPQTSQETALYARLDAQLLQGQQSRTVAAEVSLIITSDDQTFAIQESRELTVYPPGTLTWDTAAKAAAFITSTDPAIDAFARPILAAFEVQTKALGQPGHNLLKAAVLFEALKAHGIRYLSDANTPYSQVKADRSAVDHIRYPAQLLEHKAGDCDDLTVLCAALLENAGVPTALVDFPEHLFLLVDSGITRRKLYQLPLDEKLYVQWGDKVWIPLEPTQIDQSFAAAWDAGAEEISQIPPGDFKGLLIETASAWESYPSTAPANLPTAEPPVASALEAAVAAQQTALTHRFDAYIQAAYLDPLKTNPQNNALRTQLLKLYLSLHRFDAAIETALNSLLDETADNAATYNQLGIAYSLKGELTQAAFYFKQAAELNPTDQGIRRNLEQALQTLGRANAPTQPLKAHEVTKGATKKASLNLGADSFYWME